MLRRRNAIGSGVYTGVILVGIDGMPRARFVMLCEARKGTWDGEGDWEGKNHWEKMEGENCM